MECVSQDGTGGLNSSIVPLFDTFFRKIQFGVHITDDVNPALKIFVSILKIQGVSVHKVLQ